jgi:hypothetical protein
MDWLTYLGGLVLAAVVGSVVEAVFSPIRHWLSGAFGWKPIHVHVERDPKIIWAEFPPWIEAMVWLPEQPTQDPPLDCRDWNEWASASGGCDAVKTTLRITVQAKENAAVLIESVLVDRAEGPEPYKPVTTGVVAVCPVGGADVNPKRLDIDLEMDPPVGEWLDEDGQRLRERRQISLARRETDQFLVWAHAENGDHRWTLRLNLLVNGRRQTFTIDDGGKPFRTIGRHGLAAFTWYGDTWSQPK